MPKDRKKAAVKKCQSVDESGCVSVCLQCVLCTQVKSLKHCVIGVCLRTMGGDTTEVKCLHSRGIHVSYKPEGTRDFCPNPPRETHPMFSWFSFSVWMK